MKDLLLKIFIVAASSVVIGCGGSGSSESPSVTFEIDNQSSVAGSYTIEYTEPSNPTPNQTVTGNIGAPGSVSEAIGLMRHSYSFTIKHYDGSGGTGNVVQTRTASADLSVNRHADLPVLFDTPN